MKKTTLITIAAFLISIIITSIFTPTVCAEHIGNYRICANDSCTDWQENWPHNVLLEPGEWLEFESTLTYAENVVSAKHTLQMEDGKGVAVTIDKKNVTPVDIVETEDYEGKKGEVTKKNVTGKEFSVMINNKEKKKDISVLFVIKNTSKSYVALRGIRFDPFEVIDD